MRACVVRLVGLLLATAGGAAGGEWRRLPVLPDKEGFAGSFAGVSRGALVVAGGANFPDKKPWDGGKKVWHDAVFVLERPDGKWKTAGKMPRPLGYGVSVTHGEGVVCVGGSNADGHHADAFRLEWKGGRLMTTPLPALPMPLANACGALAGDVLYVAGGQEKPDAVASKALWMLDLKAGLPKWKALDPSPGEGRVFPGAAAVDGAFYLVGGAALSRGKDGKPERRYLKNAYRYDPAAGWKRIADLPHPVAAVPSPAPVGRNGFYVLGGDDGSQVGAAPDKHRGFGKTILYYDPKANAWTAAGELPTPRVTVPCVFWNKTWVVPSGEAFPGVRSPEVWGWIPGPRE